MTYNEAKEVYLRYDCSLFAMAREEKSVYEEYKLLNISSSIEEEWRQELFTVLYGKLKETGEGLLFNRMYQLSENIHDKKRLVLMKEALKYIIYDSLEAKACISETILGRKDIVVRSGMIFWAYDLGEQELAKELLKYAMNLLTIQVADENISSRFERDINKCCMIDSELHLGVCN